MSNETMINPINNSSSTVINSELQSNNATVINTEISNLSNIAEGTTLCDKYTVVSKLDINTGEADLYVCDYNSEKFIAKITNKSTGKNLSIYEPDNVIIYHDSTSPAQQ